MKKVLTLLTIIAFSLRSMAQNSYNSSKDGKAPKKSGFDADRLVLGGGLSGGFGNGVFSIGASPMVGYRITNNFMAGVSISVLYASMNKGEQTNPVTLKTEKFHARMSMISPGVWTRLNIFSNFFLQAHFEQHFINRWETYPSYTDPTGRTKISLKYNMPTLLIGAGYRAAISNKVAFYAGLSYDVLQSATVKNVYDSRGGGPYEVVSPYYRSLNPFVGFGIGF